MLQVPYKLAPFQWGNGKIVCFGRRYERCSVSLTAGKVEVNLMIAVFLHHPEKRFAAVGEKRDALSGDVISMISGSGISIIVDRTGKDGDDPAVAE